MDMCFSVYINKQEKETMKTNLDALIKCIEKGEKKLCKLFKNKKNDNIS